MGLPKKPLITQQRLKELFNYDAETGIFTRVLSSKNLYMNENPENSSNAYLRIYADGRHYKSHRLAWLYMTGHHPKEQIDHINHDTKDNRFVNLRDVCEMDNFRNQSKNKNNKSGFTGVLFKERLNKWIAQIMINRKCIHLGTFVDKKDAIKARKKANIRYGFHNNHGK